MIEKIANSRKPGPYLLSAIFFCILLSIGAFIVNEVAFFNEGFKLDRMTDLEFYATFGVFLMGVIGYIVFGKTRFHYEEPWWLDVMLLLFALGGALGIYLYPEATILPNGYNFVVSLGDKARSLCCLLTSVCSLYVALGIGPRITRGGKIALFAATLMIVIALAGVGYSLVKEREVIKHFFDMTGKFSDKVLVSFTNNRNTFGMILLFAIGASALWNSHHPNCFWYVLMFVFALTLCFVLSKTAIALSALFGMSYLTYRFFATFKGHPVRNSIWGILFVGSGIALLLAAFTEVFTPVFPGFTDFMHNFFSSIRRYGTFDARMDIWELCFSELNTPIKLLFGIGYRNVNAFLYASHFGAAGYTDWTHNGFVDLIMRNGVVGVTIGMGILVAFFAYLALSFRKENNLNMTFALLTVFFGFHGMTETTDFFSMDGKSIILVILTLYPAFSDFYRFHYNIRKEEKAYCEEHPLPKKVRYELAPVRFATIAFYALSPIVLPFLAIRVPASIHYAIPLMDHFSISLGVLSFYFTLPYICYSVRFLPKGKRLLVAFLPALLSLTSVPLGMLPHGYYAIVPSLLAALWIGLRTRQAKAGMKNHLFKKAYLPYVLIVSLVLLSVHSMDPFWREGESRYMILVALFIPVMIAFFVLEALPLRNSAYAPFAYMEDRAELKIHRCATYFDTRARYRRYLDTLPPIDRQAEKMRFKRFKTYVFPEDKAQKEDCNQ